MTAEQFVKQHYPQAQMGKTKGRGPLGKTHYLLWSSYRSDKQRLGDGTTKSAAWVDAKSRIVQQSENTKK